MPCLAAMRLLAAAGCIGVLFAVYQHSRPRVAPFSLLERRQHAQQHTKAFVLMVNLAFESETDKQAFLEMWAPLAEYVQQAEPGVLCFQLLQSDQSPTKIAVYERYITKDYYINVHRKSQPYLDMKAAWARLPFKVEVAGASFDEHPTLGFNL